MRCSPYPCACECFTTLTLKERTRSITALYRFDDAMRGFHYTPVWDFAAPRLWREAQRRNDASYRIVSVRDEACVYRRLIGFAVHELIHALCGDVTKANYGIPFGLPYGVLASVAPIEERSACVGGHRAIGGATVWHRLAAAHRARRGHVRLSRRQCARRRTRRIPRRPALRSQPAPHALLRTLSAHRGRSTRVLQRRAGGSVRTTLRGCGSRGQEAQAVRVPITRRARIAPRKLTRNDLCPCGSGDKWKRCCGK